MRHGAAGRGMGPEKGEQESSFGPGSMPGQMKSMDIMHPLIGSRANSIKGRFEMADSHQRTLWPVLRVVKLHRLYTDNTSNQYL